MYVTLKIVLAILVCAVVFHYLTNKSTENFGSTPTFSADFINFVGWLANDPKGYQALKSFLLNTTLTDNSVQIDKPLTVNGQLIASGGGRFSGDQYDINSPMNVNSLLTATAGGRFSGDQYDINSPMNVNSLLTATAGGQLSGDKYDINSPMNVNSLLTATAGGRYSGDKHQFTSPVNINALLSTTAGGRFSGDRYFFNDSENCGQLRVGCAWGKPAVFSENGKTLAFGSYSRIVSNLPVNVVGDPTTVG